MLVGGRLDPAPGRVTLVVGYVFDLVEAGDRVAHVARVVERLLAFLRESELIFVEAVALLFLEFGHCGSPLTGKRAPPGEAPQSMPAQPHSTPASSLRAHCKPGPLRRAVLKPSGSASGSRQSIPAPRGEARIRAPRRWPGD